MIHTLKKHLNYSKLVALFSFISFSISAQQDFNNFKTLVSVGPIPSDFSTKTSEKIETDFESGRVSMKSTMGTRTYLEAIHSNIDELLMSGYVVYGDEISEYVKSISENMLKNAPELKGKFRYYTIKSNETNALSTDQGIIFVTTGLIAQLSSEAQLAYVLAHEISHYTEQHVLSGYEERLKNINKRNRIERMSSYSKELELSADKLAIKLYHDAGYSLDELIPTFDVLMYSYLPFDDVAFPKNYFNSEYVFVPESEFGSKTYPIKSDEDYNDQSSSHPNIRKRKEAVQEALKSYADWKTEVNILGKEKFTYIRNVARFESLRTNIIDAELCQALYSIFLLEKEFPNSNYLIQMKALTWLSFIQLSAEEDLNDVMPKTSELEGESGPLYYFIKNLKSKEITALGLRQIADLHKLHSEDEYISKIYDLAIKNSAKNENFNFKDFSTKTFKQKAEELKLVETKNEIDTVAQPKSKYDKIKAKSDINISTTIDSVDFAMFIIPDLLKDSTFLEKYYYQKGKFDSIARAEKEFNDLPYRTQKQILRQKNSLNDDLACGLDNFIVVEPTIIVKKDLSSKEEETMAENFEEAIENAASKAGVMETTISRNTLTDGTTEMFNERNAYFSFLNQASSYKGIEIFPVDYERLKEYTNVRGTSTLMFTTAEYNFSPNLNPVIYVVSALVFPTLPFTLFLYTPVKLINGTTTEYVTILFDTNKGEVLMYKYNTVHSKPKKKINQTYYYQLINLLKKSKD